MIPFGTDHTCDHGEPWGECCPMPYGMWLRSQLYDSDRLERLPVPTPVIDGLLYADSLAWLMGRPGHGKSFVALDMAGCVATGETWQGYRTTRGDVLYLIAEGVTGLRQRVRAWEQSYGRPMVGISFLPVAVQSGNGGDWSALVELAADLRPAVVVVDTQARVTVGQDENSAEDMGRFVKALDDMRKATRACVYVVHHQGRNGDHMRGSTALDGAANTILRTEKDGNTVTLTTAKQKDAAELEPIALRLVPVGDSAVLALTDGKVRAEDVTATSAKALAKWAELFGDEWVSASALIKADVFAERTFFNVRRRLVELGLVEKAGEKSSTRYRLVPHE